MVGSTLKVAKTDRTRTTGKPPMAFGWRVFAFHVLYKPKVISWSMKPEIEDNYFNFSPKHIKNLEKIM